MLINKGKCDAFIASYDFNYHFGENILHTFATEG